MLFKSSEGGGGGPEEMTAMVRPVEGRACDRSPSLSHCRLALGFVSGCCKDVRSFR